MWPRRHLPLPIFGLDLVISGDEVRFVVADMSPVMPDGSLPPLHAAAARSLREQFLGGLEASAQPFPAWAQEILSEYAISVRPRLPVEADLCLMYATALMRGYAAAVPRDVGRLAISDKGLFWAVDAAHRRCSYLSF
jgi:hypothetical protein